MNNDTWNTYMLNNPTSHNEFLPHIIHYKPCRSLLLNLGCNIFYSQLQLLLPLVRWKVTVVLLVIPIWREVVLSKTITINHKCIRYRQHSYCGLYKGAAHIEKIKIFWRQSSVFPGLYHTVMNFLHIQINCSELHKNISQFLNFTHWPVPPLPILYTVFTNSGEKTGKECSYRVLKKKTIWKAKLLSITSIAFKVHMKKQTWTIQTSFVNMSS